MTDDDDPRLDGVALAAMALEPDEWAEVRAALDVGLALCDWDGFLASVFRCANEALLHRRPEVGRMWLELVKLFGNDAQAAAEAREGIGRLEDWLHAEGDTQ